MSSSRPSFHVSVEETAQSIRRRMHASFDEACRVQELLLDNSLHMRQVRARLMGRVNWNEGAITPDAGEVMFYLASLCRFSPRGQFLLQNAPTTTSCDPTSEEKGIIDFMINFINVVANEHFGGLGEEPLYKNTQIVCLALFGYYKEKKAHQKDAIVRVQPLSDAQRILLEKSIDKLDPLAKSKTFVMPSLSTLLYRFRLALDSAKRRHDSSSTNQRASSQFRITVADAMDWLFHEIPLEGPLDPRLMVLHESDSLATEEDSNPLSAINPENTSDEEPPLDSRLMVNASDSLSTEEDSNPLAANKNSENTSREKTPISAPAKELFYGNLDSEEHMTMEEILDCMPEVTKAFKSMVDKGYVDVQLGVTQPYEVLQNCARGRVREEKIKVPRSTFVVYIWAFDDILSSTFKQRFLQDVDEQLYMDFGEAARGGNTRGRRVLRIAGQDGTEYMHMKNSPWLIQSQKMSKREAELKKITDHVVGIMDGVLQEAAGGKRYPKYASSFLQMVAGTVNGSAYSLHSDGSEFLCHTERACEPCILDPLETSPEHTADYTTGQPNGIVRDRNAGAATNKSLHGHLPELSEMRVVTNCFANLGCLPQGSPRVVANLEIFDQSGSQPKKLCTIPTYGSTIHLQGFGAQQFTRHKVVPCANTGATFRHITSLRYSIPTSHPSFRDLLQRSTVETPQQFVGPYKLRGVYSQFTSRMRSTDNRVVEMMEDATAVVANQVLQGQGCHLPQGTGLLGISSPPIERQGPANLDTGFRYLDYLPLPVDTIPVDTRTIPAEYHVPKPAGYIEAPQSTWETMIKPDFLEAVMSRGRFVVLKYPDDALKPARHGVPPELRVLDGEADSFDANAVYPLQMPTAGDFVTWASLMDAYGIDVGQDRKNITWMHDHHGRLTFAVLTHSYKNDYENIKKIQQQLDRLRRAWVVSGEREQDFDLNLSLWIGGSGGSLSLAGQYFQSLSEMKIGSMMASGCPPKPQDPNSPLNAALLKAACRDGVIAVFVPPLVGDEWDQDRHPDCMQFLGMYQMTSFLNEKENREDVLANAERLGFSPADQLNATFRTERHFKVKLSVFPESRGKPGYYSSPVARNIAAGGMKPLNILVDDYQRKRGVKSTVRSVPRMGFCVDEGEKTVDVIGLQGCDRVNSRFIKQLLEDGIDSLEEEDITDDLGSLSTTKISLTVDQCFHACLHISTGVAFRAVRQNLHQGRAGQLWGPQTKGLGSVVLRAPTPSVMRHTDVTTAFFLLMVETSIPLFSATRRCLDHNKVDYSSFRKLILSSAMLRVTGRVERWKSFHDSRENQKQVTPYSLFDDNHLEEFLDFMYMTTGGTGKNKVTLWTSEQFRTSLPSCCKGTATQLAQFARRLVLSLVESIGWFHERTKQPDTERREQVIEKLFGILKDAAGFSEEKDSHQLYFLASQIISDLEEVILLPFGEVSFLHCGHGGSEGMLLFQRGMEDQPAAKRQRMHPEQAKSANRQAVHVQDCAVVSHMLTLLQKEATDFQLDVLFMEKDGNGNLVAKYNQRPINAVDIEHIWCKMYLLIHRSRGSRAYSSPKPARPHCHPSKSEGMHSSSMEFCFEEAVSAFLRIRETAQFPDIPIQFQWIKSDQGGVTNTSEDERRNVAGVEPEPIPEQNLLGDTLMKNLDLLRSEESLKLKNRMNKVRSKEIALKRDRWNYYFGEKVISCATKNGIKGDTLLQKLGVVFAKLDVNEQSGVQFVRLNLFPSSLQKNSEVRYGTIHPKRYPNNVWDSIVVAADDDKGVKAFDNRVRNAALLAWGQESGECFLRYQGLSSNMSGDTERNRHARPNQKAHTDYSLTLIEQERDRGINIPLIAFAPATKEGMMIHVWSHEGDDGRFIFVPLGYLLVLKGDVVHAGGFSFGSENHHERIHMYILPTMSPPFVGAIASNSFHYRDFVNNVGSFDLDPADIVRFLRRGLLL